MRQVLFRILSRLHVFYENMKIQEIKNQLVSCGDYVTIGHDSQITPYRVSIGNRSALGEHTKILSTRANVKIGNDVMFGPGVTIITGNHRTDMVGRTMISVRDDDKRPEDDEDVVIQDDVWIGANVTILKGVTIGTGSVVAAGSVVTKSIPSYEIWGGPAHCIRKRFTEDVLQEHIRLLKNGGKIDES